jgi:hypothetical protein
LRTCLLDPSRAVNNLERHTSFGALKASRRRINTQGVHPSYDINGDGFVGPYDMKMAKKFDVDGSGTLDAAEQKIGRLTMTRDFFRANERDLFLIAPKFAKQCDKDGDGTFDDAEIAKVAEELAATPRRFLANYNYLAGRARFYRLEGSHGVKNCLTNPHLHRARDLDMDGQAVNLPESFSQVPALGRGALANRISAPFATTYAHSERGQTVSRVRSRSELLHLRKMQQRVCGERKLAGKLKDNIFFKLNHECRGDVFHMHQGNDPVFRKPRIGQ